MITPQEKAEKMRQASKTTGRFIKKHPEAHDKRMKEALEHEHDAGLSSVDEYVYLKKNQVEGK